MTGFSRLIDELRSRRGGWATVVLIAALLGCACSDSNGSAPSSPAPNTAPPLPSATAPPTSAPATPTSLPSPAASPSASSSVVAALTVPTSAGTRQDVIAGVKRTLDARYVSPLNRNECLKDNPNKQICFDVIASEGAIRAGIARLLAGDPEGGAFALLMGRTAAGEWKMWRGTQQEFFELFELPGTLRTCNGASDAPVRAAPEPAATIVGRVADKELLKAEQFVLTKPGSLSAPGDRPQGFYRVTSPVAGWIDALAVADAASGDCALHDSTLGISHG